MNWEKFIELVDKYPYRVNGGSRSDWNDTNGGEAQDSIKLYPEGERITVRKEDVENASVISDGTALEITEASGYKYTLEFLYIEGVESTPLRLPLRDAQTNTRQVPEGVKPLPEDKPWLAYAGEIEDTGEIRPWLWCHSRIFKYDEWNNRWGGGYAGGGGHYAIDTRHPEAQEYFPEICAAHNAARPRVWEVEVEMLVEGNEHIWHKYVEGNNEEDARRRALEGCCHCDPEDVHWEADNLVTCAETYAQYSILNIREAPWRESV